MFNGQGERPWKTDDAVEPLNWYGMTKQMGEAAVKKSLDRYFIVRTSWVYGLNGSNFVGKMLSLADTHDSVRVVSDQIGSPTYTKDLAVLLSDMAGSERYGIYHATNGGAFISFYELCRTAFRLGGKTTEVIPVTTEEYGGNIALRPKNSRLDKSKLAENGFEPLPEWEDALKRYLLERKEVLNG